MKPVFTGATEAASIGQNATERMERDWDARAREAAEFYIATAQREWSEEEFFRSGEINVDNEVLADADLFPVGANPREMRMLEIGCGAGRMTRALAAEFGEVHGVDVSGEMIALARKNLAGLGNVSVSKSNGCDLAGLPDRSFDFAFSFIVFQHIPSAEVIDSYVGEVYRCLKPGAIFKFQVSGAAAIEQSDDTWVGTSFSPEEARSLAARHGFDLLRMAGEGSQYFWLWFQKPKWGWMPGWARRLVRAGQSWVKNRAGRRIAVTFEPRRVEAGGSYQVQMPEFGGHTIDIAYALDSGSAGTVGRWCELDAEGKATIAVPAEHPAGTVRITGVRSRSAGGGWMRAAGVIEVLRNSRHE